MEIGKAILRKCNAWICSDCPPTHIHVVLDIATLRHTFVVQDLDLCQQPIKVVPMHITPSLLLVCYLSACRSKSLCIWYWIHLSQSSISFK